MNDRGTISPERIKWRNKLGCHDIAITTLRVDRWSRSTKGYLLDTGKAAETMNPCRGVASELCGS
jgi:predicted ABC-type ATPase